MKRPFTLRFEAALEIWLNWTFFIQMLTGN
jgi:hypothetical protein